jgi:hypothetical protein
MKVAAIELRARGYAPGGSPRSQAAGFNVTTENAGLTPCGRGRAVALQTSMPSLISKSELSIAAASQSEPLDNPEGSRYGLELVIPMSSRRLETW